MSKPTTVTVVVIEPGKPLREEKLNRNTFLASVQRLVGGNVEMPPLIKQKTKICIYVNEEGMMRNLPQNDRAANLIDRRFLFLGALLYGTAVLSMSDGKQDLTVEMLNQEFPEWAKELEEGSESDEESEEYSDEDDE